MALTNFHPTVLLIDELNKDCLLMTSWLETNGYNVRQANHIYDALEEVTDITLEQRPSMILLNSYSSSQDCLWVMDTLHEFSEKRAVPIVSLSALNDENDSVYSDDNYLQVENFDLLKPLMKTLLPVYPQQLQKAA